MLRLFFFLVSETSVFSSGKNLGKPTNFHLMPPSTGKENKFFKSSSKEEERSQVRRACLEGERTNMEETGKGLKFIDRKINHFGFLFLCFLCLNSQCPSNNNDGLRACLLYLFQTDPLNFGRELAETGRFRAVCSFVTIGGKCLRLMIPDGDKTLPFCQRQDSIRETIKNSTGGARVTPRFATLSSW